MVDRPARDSRLALGGLLALLAALAAHALLGYPSGLPAAAITSLMLVIPVLLAGNRGAAALGIAVRPVAPSLLWFAAFAALTLPPFFLLYPRLSGAWWFPFPPYAPAFDAPALLRESLLQTLGVALPEEFFCRGFLQSAWGRARTRTWNVLGARVGWEWPAASAAFALLHVPGAGAAGLGTFLPGLAFGWLFARTGRIWAGTLHHAACNVALVALTGATGSG